VTNSGTGTIQRQGNVDNDTAGDFSWVATASKGTQNAGLSVPFTGGATPVSITPLGNFVDGMWTGQVTVHELADNMWLRVDDGSGHLSASNTFDVVPVNGDYNRNLTVDAADYVLWRKTLAMDVTPFSGADGSGDGIVGPEDYRIWTAQFGQTSPEAVSGAGEAASSVASDAPITTSPATPRITVAANPPADSGELTFSAVMPDPGISLQTGPRLVTGSQRLTAAPLEAGKRDAALVAWLASRSSGGGASAEDLIETFGREADANSSASLLDALDTAFEKLSADAA
jgi:hypothetical protein